MNPIESALSRWTEVPDTPPRGVESPACAERDLDGEGSDGRERHVGAGLERATVRQLPTSPAGPDAATGPGVRDDQRYHDEHSSAVASGALRWWRDSHPSVATPPDAAAEERARTRVAEHLGELRQLIDHLRAIRLRTPADDEAHPGLTLRNDVLFSRLMICTVAIDLAGALIRQRGERCDDDMRALRKLVGDRRVPPEVVGELERLLGFRNALMQGSVTRDMTGVRTALEGIEALERFLAIAHEIATSRR